MKLFSSVQMAQQKGPRRPFGLTLIKPEPEQLKYSQDIMERKVDPMSLYKLNFRIGRGSFGDVYKATHKKTQKVVALKVMNTMKSDSYEYKALEQEVAIMRDCRQCEFIVTFHGAWLWQAKIHIAMEYCVGGSVHDVMQALKEHNKKDQSSREINRLKQVQIAAVCHDVLQALVFLHANDNKKYIHRDIKAQNIMVDAKGCCKLSDFGASFIKMSTNHKAKTVGVGTWHWMAPEVMAKGARLYHAPHDCEADIWSLGITAIQMTDSQSWQSFIKMSENELIGNVTNMNTPPPSLSDDKGRFGQKFGADFKKFIAKCLVKNKDARPSAAELLQDRWIKVASKSARLSMQALMANVTPILSKMRRADVVNIANQSDKDDDDSKDEVDAQPARGIHGRRMSVGKLSRADWLQPNADSLISEEEKKRIVAELREQKKLELARLEMVYGGMEAEIEAQRTTPTD